MQNKTFFLVGLFSLLMSASLGWSQVYVETVTMGGLSMKVWTSGDKQREEIGFQQGSQLDGMMDAVAQNTIQGMGETIKIKRLDKGVEWTLYPARKVYTEQPLAIPYSPGTESSALGTDIDVNQEKERAMKMSVRKAAQARTVAGIGCDGYEILLDGKVQQRIWVAAATGVVKKVMEETDRFQDKLQKVQYAQWPAQHVQEMMEGLKILEGLAANLQSFGKMPDGYPMFVEMVGDTAQEPGVMMEVKQLRAGDGAAALFEIPAGYTLSTESGIQEQMMQNMMNTLTMPPEEE